MLVKLAPVVMDVPCNLLGLFIAKMLEALIMPGCSSTNEDMAFYTGKMKYGVFC